jgi:hypothetical protein
VKLRRSVDEMIQLKKENILSRENTCTVTHIAGEQTSLFYTILWILGLSKYQVKDRMFDLNRNHGSQKQLVKVVLGTG